MVVCGYDMNKPIERIQRAVKDRAAEFCLDNPNFYGKNVLVETIMLMGVAVVMSMPIDEAEEEEVCKLTDTPEGQAMLKELFADGPIRNEGRLLSSEERAERCYAPDHSD